MRTRQACIGKCTTVAHPCRSALLPASWARAAASSPHPHACLPPTQPLIMVVALSLPFGAFEGWGLSHRPPSRAGCVPFDAGFSCSGAACVALVTPSSSSSPSQLRTVLRRAGMHQVSPPVPLVGKQQEQMRWVNTPVGWEGYLAFAPPMILHIVCVSQPLRGCGRSR